MAQKAHDQACLHTQLSPRITNRAMETFDHRREWDTTGCVSLRVEEHLDMADIISARSFEICPGEVVEILLRFQHGHALIVDVEKILQVPELIGLPQRID